MGGRDPEQKTPNPAPPRTPMKVTRGGGTGGGSPRAGGDAGGGPGLPPPPAFCRAAGGKFGVRRVWGDGTDPLRGGGIWGEHAPPPQIWLPQGGMWRCQRGWEPSFEPWGWHRVAPYLLGGEAPTPKQGLGQERGRLVLVEGLEFGFFFWVSPRGHRQAGEFAPPPVLGWRRG